MYENYKNTFWKSKNKKYTIYAVVRQSGINLIAWELELRSGSVYHPAYGLIPKEYVFDFDMFISEADGRVPEYIFDIKDTQFYCLNQNLKQILRD